MTNTRPANGFTLIEVIIALAIFALVALGASVSLSLALEAKDQSTNVSAAQRDLSLLRSILRADLTQAVLRPTRDPFGGNPPNSFYGGQLADSESLLVFTRRGWVNPGGRAQRGNIQHVEYRFEAGQLIRRTRARLDPGPDTPTYDQVLMDGLDDARVEFKIGRTWNQVVRIDGQSSAPLPDVVALITEDADRGQMRQLFLLRGETP